MREQTYLFPAFIFSCIIAVVFFVLGTFGLFGWVTNSIQVVFFPITHALHGSIAQNSQTTLSKENARLTSMLSDKNQLVQDNKALRDQFETPVPVSNSVLPAIVVGTDSIIPNLSFPQHITIAVGTKDGVHAGQAVVVRNELIGIVEKVSNKYSLVKLVTALTSSLAGKMQATGAIGVIKGQGDGMLLDNVGLSDTIRVGDVVVTIGTQDVSGKGIPPDLIIGKAVSIEKNPSSLFQKARVVPLVSFAQLEMVFVMTE